MGEKYVALLVVCLLMGVSVGAMTVEEKRNDCNSYCNRACMFPASFCKWWCGGRCENPIFWEDSLIEDVSKKYPQPTEASYKAYKAAHPEESSSTTEKTEM